MTIKMYGCQLPFHIQEEILKRLPVKSLVLFRSVSKAWKSLIDSSQFIAAHSLGRHTQSQHLLVLSENWTGMEKYVCYTDDDTLPQQRSVSTLPLSIKQLKNPEVVGSSHGLVFLYGYTTKMAVISHGLVFLYGYTTKMAVIWNPSIRKSIVVAVPGEPLLGFGVCPKTHDPKIVIITKSFRNKTDIETKVMVYTLSSGKWRSLSKNLPTKPNWHAKVTTDRFIYWHVRSPIRDLIMSLDVTNESFEMIDLPDTLATRYGGGLIISKVRESLALLQFQYREYNYNCDVWMMEHGDQRLFIKLYTVTASDEIVGFRKSGIPIMDVRDGNPYDDEEQGRSKLVVYEPNSEHNNVLETSDFPYTTFHVNAYIETLLLLGRSDSGSC